MKKIMSGFLLVSIVFSILFQAMAVSPEVKEIKLEVGNLFLRVGQKYNLKVTVSPNDASQEGLIYVSNNQKIAVVDQEGQIEAKAKGLTTIKVYSPNKKIYAQTVVKVISKLSDAVTVSIVAPDAGRVLKENNPVINEISKRINVNLKVQLIPSAQFNNKYTIIAAVGEIPDISRLNNFDFQVFAAQGFYKDIGKLLKTNAPNILRNVKPESLDLCKFRGAQYAIPYENAEGKNVNVVRKDWLDNLGMKVPTTLNQYISMVKKFTYNDPDKNGKKDTYGIEGYNGWTTDIPPDFQPIFGAFGIAPQQYYIRNNKMYASVLLPEYKNAIKVIKELWDAKVIDPDLFILKSDQAGQRLVQSKAGSFTAWWSIAPQVLNVSLKMKEINPQSKWVPIFPGIKGTSGKGGMMSFGTVGGTVSISSKSKNPEAALRVLDFLESDEGYTLAYWGVKGEDYIVPGQRTASGQKAFDEKWLDPLSQIMNRFDLYVKWYEKSTDPVMMDKNTFMNAGMKYNLFRDALYEVPATEEKISRITDLKKYEMEMFAKFVTGVESLNNWNNYVETWKTKGGKAILDSMVNKYNDMKNKNITVGY